MALEQVVLFEQIPRPFARFAASEFGWFLAKTDDYENMLEPPGDCVVLIVQRPTFGPYHFHHGSDLSETLGRPYSA